MSNKHNLSQQSIDTIFKLSIDLRKELLEQLRLFEPLKNEYLLTELKKIIQFRNKRIKNQTSIMYLEININQIKKIIDILCKLEAYNHFKDSFNSLASKLDKIKEEVISELIMLPTKLCLKINEDNNSNNGQYYENNKSTNDEEKTNKLFSLIFKYLSINDLFNCRLVNKKFKKIIDHTNGINKLIIGQPYSMPEDYYWYYNYKLIEDKDIISLKCFRTIQKLSIFNLDTNLKYLKIYDSKFKLEEISNLINLQSIEFGNYYNPNNQQILNLNNLKVFVSNSCDVKLNTPKLERIQFYNINNIKLNSNPELIKHLITCDYDNKLEIFKNLEIMELRDIDRPINENLLSLFRNLKQLKINLSSTVDYSDERIKNSLIKILNDKMKLKRSIDIYLEGVNIENIDKFNELVSIKYCKLWKFRLNNYDLLDLNLSSINRIDYSDLEECVTNIENDLPSSFFDKFIYINHVHVNSVNNIDGLNWFLNKLKYLMTLRIYVSLDEVFYNNLPNTIRELTIYNREDINYDFILKLSRLIEFNTEIDKDLFDLAFTSFLNLKYLNEFQFYYKKKRIIIEKNGKCFNLYHNYNEIKRELDYNQLIEECNKIKIRIRSK